MHDSDDLRETFADEVARGETIVVMPVARFRTELPFHVGPYHFFPAYEVDLRHLRPVTVDEEYAMRLRSLRWLPVTATRIDARDIAGSSIVAFTTDLDWNDFHAHPHHDDDLDLLRRLSALAERSLDLLRYRQCRPSFPDELPGYAGSLDRPTPHSAALLYNAEDHESYVVAGSILTSQVTKSLGLDVEISQALVHHLPGPGDGEAGAVIQRALAIFSEALYANTDTSRFIALTGLLEFLAAPYEYVRWQDVKREIISHVATTKSRYTELSDRFRELSSVKVNGVQKGIRTLLVHHGYDLIEVVPDRTERANLFDELHAYATRAIDFLIDDPTRSWAEVVDLRKERRVAMGVG